MMHTEPRNTAAVQAALSGDLGAWDAIVDQWLPTLLQWARRLGGSGIDAEDVTQEVLETAWRRLDSVHNASVFEAWLFGITRRMVAKHRRRAWLRRWIPGLDPVDMAHADPPDVSRTELSRRVQQVLDQLSTAHREVLVLCDMEERTSAEVSVLLGIPHATVRSRLRVARERFRVEAASVLVFQELLEEDRP